MSPPSAAGDDRPEPGVDRAAVDGESDLGSSLRSVDGAVRGPGVDATAAPRHLRDQFTPVTFRLAPRIAAFVLMLVLVGGVLALIASGAVGWWADVVWGYLEWLPFL